MHTQEQQIGIRCYKEARRQFGNGWDLLTIQVKRMAISEKVLDVLYAQYSTDETTPDFIMNIGRAAFAELGE